MAFIPDECHTRIRRWFGWMTKCHSYRWFLDSWIPGFRSPIFSSRTEMASDETKDVFCSHISYININLCDSRRMGIVKIINPYRIRLHKIAPWKFPWKCNHLRTININTFSNHIVHTSNIIGILSHFESISSVCSIQSLERTITFFSV